MTPTQRFLRGLSLLFGFSVFGVAAVLAVTSIFEIALREQVLALVKSEKDISRPRISLDTSLGDMMVLQGGGHGKTQGEQAVTRARGDAARP